MACGCSKGGNASIQNAVREASRALVSSGQIPQGMPADMVLIEVIGEGLVNRTYVGRPTGSKYIFASEGPRSKRYVHRSDAEYFITNFGHLFRLADVGDKTPVGVAN